MDKNSERTVKKPLVVLGSVNADLFLELDRLPKPGETVGAFSSQTFPGGKGANQAACAASLGYPTHFIGQVGEDTFGQMLSQSLLEKGVNLQHLSTIPVSSGQAIVLLQTGGQNSIVIVGGANMAWTKSKPKPNSEPSFLPSSARELILQSSVLLLQREIPEDVNIEAAKIAHEAGVEVILDCGGMDSPLSSSLLSHTNTFSPNQTELARITNLPTETMEEIVIAAQSLLDKGVDRVLVKMGEQGSLMIMQDAKIFKQPIIPAPEVVDTTGAGDTYTAAYAVCISEGMDTPQALIFATASASLCVRKKGAMPSMPNREEVESLIKTIAPIALFK